MMPSRSELKSEAKEIMKTSKPNVIFVGLAYILLSFLFSALSSRILYGKVSQLDVTRYLQLVQEGNLDYALSLAQSLVPSTTAKLIDTLLSLVLSIVQAGFVIFIFNTIRRNAPCFGNLLDGFGFAIKIIALYILTGLFILLWSLLLIVPGIVASYEYRLALYILIDDPGKTPMQCIRESKHYMKGHKMELFKLDLSFLGWNLLSEIPSIGYAAKVWVLPYTEISYALYYEYLCGNRSGIVYTDRQV